MKHIITAAMAALSLTTACADKPQKAAMASSENSSKVLVAYFSCTGNTERAAKTIAAVTGADLYRITPEKPYTAADLDWQNDKSRSSVEMRNPQSRPALGGPKADVAKYNIIFLGYPIWWYTHPTIINSFIEAYNLKGKTVIPFCTSGGSTIDKSVADLKSHYKDIVWKKGGTLNGGENEIKTWVKTVMPQ